MPRLCLSMIVRNEAHVIERCLDHARPIVSAVDICDTGSTDDTVAVVRRWLRRNRARGRVHQYPFVDFGRTRTRALRAARRTVLALGWHPADAYLLLLDADMVLEIGPDFAPDRLWADAYRLIQRNGPLQYPNVRLVRASVPARFIGATHEYLDLPDGTTVESLEALAIDDRNDGGSRADKYARDERLLQATLARDPADGRAMFYLAQTYRGQGELAKALVWYRRRSAAGGWEEEAWYAQYAIGLILLEGGERRAAFRALAQALRRDPSRPEPYFHLAALLRKQQHFRWATRLALAGQALGIPQDRSLFVDREICEWGFLRELSISAYFTEHREIGRAANEQLALRRGSPASLADQALGTSVLYARPLRDAVHHSLRPVLPPTFAPCNPSIVRTDDGYLVNCRAVSYWIDHNHHYWPTEPDGILRTRNVLVRLDRQLSFLGQQEVTHAIAPLRSVVVQGLEDLRLVTTPDGLAATCTTTEFHPAGPVRVSLLELADTGHVLRHVPLVGYGEDLVQKNWLPFWAPGPGRLRAVYGYAPFVILEIDPASGQCAPVVTHDHARPFDTFRGSAGPVPLPAEVGGGHLLIVHEVAAHRVRYYQHRFVRVDDDWHVTEVSAPFIFRQTGIEFACGACLSHEGDLIVTFGSMDREAWISRVPLDAVIRLLQPLPD